MSSMIGISARPFSVSAYSTRGGTSEKVSRSTTPSSSSARSRSDRVRGLMPASDRSSSQKRQRPAAEQTPQPAASSTAAGGRRDPALGGLHEHPALPGEGDLDALPGALPDQVLDVDIGLDRR